MALPSNEQLGRLKLLLEVALLFMLVPLVAILIIRNPRKAAEHGFIANK